MEVEKALFKIFLASANLPDEKREIALKQFKSGANFGDFSASIHKNCLLKRFLLDVSALTVLANLQSLTEERDFLDYFCVFLDIPKTELEETRVMVGNFVLNNNNKVSFLKSSSSYEKMFSSVSHR